MKTNIYIIGYSDKPGQLVYIETDSIITADRIKRQMEREGHEPFIDVYTR